MTQNSAPKFQGFMEIVPPNASTVEITDNGNTYGTSYNALQLQLPTLVHGTTARLDRYREYDVMDTDLDISQALDLVAEEMTTNTGTTKLPFNLSINSTSADNINDGVVPTLNAALKVWCDLHSLDVKVFDICRQVVKYADVFFIRPDKPNEPWRYVPPNCIMAAVVHAEDVTKVTAWVCRIDNKSATNSTGFAGGYSTPVNNTTEAELIPAERMIRFTLNNDMSPEAPFGISPLSYVYRAQKKKQMLEDAIVIYRIQRAPERRAFYIDVGKMPPNRVKQYLDSIKNEMKQKVVPANGINGATVDSIYNPQSMSEDFYFAVRTGGTNSRVETLPGGQNLGELTDLEYFRMQVLQGLRIPPSYLPSMQSMSSVGTISDGVNGTLYMPEIQFTKYVKRLQSRVNKTFDHEFKKFVRAIGINVDASLYKITLNNPTNYEEYREAAINTELLTAYGNADGIQHLSKRFSMMKYLRMSMADIKLNEQMVREENGIDHNKYNGIVRIYNPDSMGMDSADDDKFFGGGGGSGSGSPLPGGSGPGAKVDGSDPGKPGESSPDGTGGEGNSPDDSNPGSADKPNDKPATDELKL